MSFKKYIKEGVKEDKLVSGTIEKTVNNIKDIIDNAGLNKKEAERIVNKYVALFKEKMERYLKERAKPIK
jgi:hypothetical protein